MGNSTRVLQTGMMEEWNIGRKEEWSNGVMEYW
jgi:hypothetical protein